MSRAYIQFGVFFCLFGASLIQGDDLFGMNGLDASPVQYRLSFRQAETHRVDIELSVPSDGKAEVEFFMPVWTPGSYLVREYARQVESVSAYDGTTNAPLTIKKTDKNHWTVASQNASEVTLRYSLYCRELSVRTNWVERDFAFLTGAATFLTRSDYLDHPHIVKIDAIPSWTEIATSLPMVQAKDAWIRMAKNFDELVDSPILLGSIQIEEFESGGSKHYLATLGGETFWDHKQAAQDVAKIVMTEQKFWNETPYRDYWFLNLATESGGGLEHDNSCVLMTGRWTQRQKSKYVDWLALVSHEFFHAWNVRRLRPKVLQKYDYNQEQYFDELWVAEGITSYYDDLFVMRSGLCKPKDYLDRISKNITAVQNSPGRLTQSLSNSSFDTWIKFYRPDENASNSRVNYYLKGALVGMLLDVEIRAATENAKTLDDVMRTLWKQHRDTGYTNDDFHKVVEQVAGISLAEWLDNALNSTEELDYTKFLNWYGLDWKARESDKDAAAEKVFGGIFVGMELKAEQGKAMVDRVMRDSPASDAGFNVGDELIGFDGFRISSENWTERVNLYKPHQTIKCIIARRGKLLELSMKLGALSDKTWNLVRTSNPTEAQEERWRNWLELPAEPPKEKGDQPSPAK